MLYNGLAYFKNTKILKYLKYYISSTCLDKTVNLTHFLPFSNRIARDLIQNSYDPKFKQYDNLRQLPNNKIEQSLHISS